MIDIEGYLNQRPEKYRDASRDLYQFIMKRAVNIKPKLHGDIIGWGDDGKGWFLLGLCARATGVMLYSSARVLDPHDELLRSRRTGITCVKLTRLGTLDESVLDDIVTSSLHPPSDGKQHAGKVYAERAASKERLSDFQSYLADKPEKVHDVALRLYTMIRNKISEEAYAYDCNVLGFGKRDDGWFKVCMAARGSGVMLYTTEKILDNHADVIKKSWRSGKGCLKLTRWDQLPEAVIEDIIDKSLES